MVGVYVVGGGGDVAGAGVGMYVGSDIVAGVGVGVWCRLYLCCC